MKLDVSAAVAMLKRGGVGLRTDAAWDEAHHHEERANELRAEAAAIGPAIALLESADALLRVVRAAETAERTRESCDFTLLVRALDELPDAVRGMLEER